MVPAVDLTTEIRMRSRKASPNGAPLPPVREDLLNLSRHQLGIEEKKRMEMRVPAVSFPVGDFQCADVTTEADPGAELLADLALVELRPRRVHALEQVGEIVPEAVRNGEGDEIDGEAQRLGAVDSLLDFQ